MKKINKSSPLPLYYQLKENILAAIQADEFTAGEQLPAERELAEYNNISRMTVKKAVDILVDSGYLIRKQGSGTFITDYQDNYSISPLLSFSQEMQKKGLDYKTKLLKFEIIPAAELAEKLNCQPDDKVYHLERLRIIEAHPFLLENTYLPSYLFPELSKQELSNSSLYQLIQDKYKLKLTNVEAEVEAIMFNDQIAQKMDLKAGSLGLYFEQSSFDAQEQLVEFTSAYYRNNNYKFKFNFNLT
ncbi:GntR family transcriptional regulator [Halanaerobium salsuginis]|jgi:GntR family transcriptional regulator|uniref:GntR family transcriptional regulator n=1 Tax=Halanaerobium salsuginis TaxID=29563 RepID=A0A1I4J2I7_9FIRM|nr:GntR family transcriptional regulator [Halanaerobium salsuginis]SFL60832.1 GntR family transcriptional regulator [Halanaerobium salsuginis]